MMHLANNFSYRYIKDDKNVFTICRHKANIIPQTNGKTVSPLRFQYYTEPFTDKKGVINNALFAFSTPSLCYQWCKKIDKIRAIDDKLIDTMELFDLPPSSIEDSMISSIEMPLYDVKSISETLHLPLIVILSYQNEVFDVFYHNIEYKLKA